MKERHTNKEERRLLMLCLILNEDFVTRNENWLPCLPKTPSPKMLRTRSHFSYPSCTGAFHRRLRVITASRLLQYRYMMIYWVDIISLWAKNFDGSSSGEGAFVPLLANNVRSVPSGKRVLRVQSARLLLPGHQVLPHSADHDIHMNCKDTTTNQGHALFLVYMGVRL